MRNDHRVGFVGACSVSHNRGGVIWTITKVIAEKIQAPVIGTYISHPARCKWACLNLLLSTPSLYICSARGSQPYQTNTTTTHPSHISYPEPLETMAWCSPAFYPSSQDLRAFKNANKAQTKSVFTHDDLYFGSNPFRPALSHETLTPLFDIRETKEAYFLEGEFPGISAQKAIKL